MKLIIQNSRIIGTATDAYNGMEESISPPVEFDQSLIDKYVVANGIASLPPDFHRRALIASIDADADRIYADVIGNRGTEYAQAEKEAQAYKDAAYTGTVPSSVQSWATVKAWTPTQAADDILAQAASWRTVAAAIRSNRLAEKEAARASIDLAGIAASQVRWSGFVTYIRGQLGV